jgi:TRAP-type transport system periplasmic protein
MKTPRRDATGAQPKETTMRIPQTLIAVGALCFAAAAQAQDIKERTIRVGIGLSEEHPQAMAVRKFGELLKASSGGKITVKLYASGSLGNDVTMISALQGGTLDMTVPDASTLTSHVKDFGVLNLPYTFNTEAEADAVLDGPLGKKMLAKLPEKGLIGLAFWENGFRHVTNKNKAIKSAADFAGLKLRVIPNPLFIETFNAIGANAVPLPFPELYTAMETGAVDGQENPVATILASKFYEVQKNLVLSRHMYSVWVMLMSKKKWDAYSPAEQKLVTAAADEAKLYERQTIRDFSVNAIAELKKNGMTVTEFSAADVAALRTKVMPVVAKFSNEFGAAAASELNNELQTLRAKK